MRPLPPTHAIIIMEQANHSFTNDIFAGLESFRLGNHNYQNSPNNYSKVDNSSPTSQLFGSGHLRTQSFDGGDFASFRAASPFQQQQISPMHQFSMDKTFLSNQDEILPSPIVPSTPSVFNNVRRSSTPGLMFAKKFPTEQRASGHSSTPSQGSIFAFPSTSSLTNDIDFNMSFNANFQKDQFPNSLESYSNSIIEKNNKKESKKTEKRPSIISSEPPALGSESPVSENDLELNEDEGDDEEEEGDGTSEKKLHPCPHPGCGRLFTRLYNVKSHMVCHSGDRPYCCSECPASFRRKHDLQRHFRTTHSNERPWVCNLCSRSFARRDHYRRHMQVEEKEGERRKSLMAEMNNFQSMTMPLY